MSARGLFTMLICACSGQPAPTPDKPKPIIVDAAPAPVTPDAPIVPSALGQACGIAQPCGPDLTCDAGFGGTCSMACSIAGSACGNGGICVEYPLANACRPPCSTTEDCRADEGYACDPVWKGCVLANAPTIAPLPCPAPTGFGRDPAFAPPTGLGNGVEPAAVIADDGSVVAVFEDGLGIRGSRVDLKGATELTVATGFGAPSLIRDGASLLVAMASRTHVAVSMSKDRGQTWSSPAVISDCAECRPTIVAGNERGGRVSYLAYAASGGIRVQASRDGGASFGAPITAVPGTRASLAISADGTLHVVALRGSPRGSYGSGDQEILYASSSTGGRSFTKPVLISRYSERIPFYFGTPRIEVDSARKWIYIAYTRGGRDAKWDLGVVAIKDLTKPWVRQRIGDDGSCAATYFAPQLALDSITGALHLAWYDSRGNRYAHGVCTDGLRACRQLGRINDEAFANLSLAPRKTASESTTLVVDNQRRALHAVWSQPGPEATRILHAKAKLPPR